MILLDEIGLLSSPWIDVCCRHFANLVSCPVVPFRRNRYWFQYVAPCSVCLYNLDSVYDDTTPPTPVPLWSLPSLTLPSLTLFLVNDSEFLFLFALLVAIVWVRVTAITMGGIRFQYDNKTNTQYIFKLLVNITPYYYLATQMRCVSSPAWPMLTSNSSFQSSPPIELPQFHLVSRSFIIPIYHSGVMHLLDHDKSLRSLV